MKSNPARDNEIYKYVCHSTVNDIRTGFEKGYFDSDYFTKSQDIGPGWLDTLVVHPAVILDEAISIVPVSFTPGKSKRHHLVVFLLRDAGVLCITKVSGAQHFLE